MPTPNRSDYYRYMSDANAAAQSLGLNPAGATDGAWDAFRHAYASAEMTREYGEAWARALGDLNEFKNPGGFFDGSANMDLWNNARGREIGRASESSQDTVRRVKDALDSGKLILHPGDLRDRYGDDYDGIFPQETKEKVDDVKDSYEKGATTPSPIILDLNGDGVTTTAITAGVFFDHSNDGLAERSGWVGQDDGLLVRDLNGDGRIDSGRELFGSETLLANGSKAANGFVALAELDRLYAVLCGTPLPHFADAGLKG